MKAIVFVLITIITVINVPVLIMHSTPPIPLFQGESLIQSFLPIIFNMTKPFSPAAIFQVLGTPAVSTFYPNGTIQFEANKSIFRISPPNLSGISLSSFLHLYSNSSMVQYIYSVPPAIVTLNITKIKNSYNLKVGLVGKGIPIIGNTTIVLSFTNINLSKVTNDTNFNVFFGQTGFDWSDTKGFLPTFSNSILTWTVASNFVIDPSIVFVSGGSGGLDSTANGRIDISLTPTAGNVLVIFAGNDNAGAGCHPTFFRDNIDGITGWNTLDAVLNGAIYIQGADHLNIPSGITSVSVLFGGCGTNASNDVATVVEYSGVGSFGVHGSNSAAASISSTPTITCPTNCNGSIGTNSWLAGGTTATRDVSGPTTTVGTSRELALTPLSAAISTKQSDNTSGTITWSWGTFKPAWSVDAIELVPSAAPSQNSFGEII